jgi:TatD DNase family protein
MSSVPELIDSHCHLDVEAFATDRDAVWQRARAAGVRQIVVPGIRAATWQPLVELCVAEAGWHAALGLHPMFMHEHAPADLAQLPGRLEQHRPVAVGEIGLDYFIAQADHDAQQALFAAQLAIAREAGLPVILHVRKAHDEVLKHIRASRVVGGIAHAFNGSPQQAQQYIELGFKLGFGGMLTYARSTKLRTLARDLPIEAIVLETDAPDMTVASHHGERNSPEYLPECLAALAGVRNEDPLEVAAQTSLNARTVLNLPDV